MAETDKLDSLVRLRDADAQGDILSFLMVQWGVVNILGIWIWALVWNSLFFWVFWIPACVLLMMAVVSLRSRGLDRSIWGYHLLPTMWIVVHGALPLIIWYFPEVLQLYSVDWIFPLTTLWAALGMYATGVFIKRWQVAVGALVWVAAAPFYLIFPFQAIWIFTAANIAGFVVPGLVRYHGNRT